MHLTGAADQLARKARQLRYGDIQV